MLALLQPWECSAALCPFRATGRTESESGEEKRRRGKESAECGIRNKASASLAYLEDPGDACAA